MAPSPRFPVMMDGNPGLAGQPLEPPDKLVAIHREPGMTIGLWNLGHFCPDSNPGGAPSRLQDQAGRPERDRGIVVERMPDRPGATLLYDAVARTVLQHARPGRVAKPQPP